MAWTSLNTSMQNYKRVSLMENLNSCKDGGNEKAHLSAKKNGLL
jgi:hypothetical protein